MGRINLHRPLPAGVQLRNDRHPPRTVTPAPGGTLFRFRGRLFFIWDECIHAAMARPFRSPPRVVRADVVWCYPGTPPIAPVLGGYMSGADRYCVPESLRKYALHYDRVRNTCPPYG